MNYLLFLAEFLGSIDDVSAVLDMDCHCGVAGI